MFFETILISDGHMPLWQWHWERVERTAAALECAPLCDWKGTLMNFIKLHNVLNAALKATYIPNNPNVPHIQLRNLRTEFENRIPIYPRYKQTYLFENFKIVDRTFYEEATAYAQTYGFSEAIIINEQKELCETTIGNIWIEIDGVLATPPLSSGCIAGVKRAKILNDKQVLGFQTIERTINLSEIKSGQLYMSNAIRGIYPIKIAD